MNAFSLCICAFHATSRSQIAYFINTMRPALLRELGASQQQYLAGLPPWTDIIISTKTFNAHRKKLVEHGTLLISYMRRAFYIRVTSPFLLHLPREIRDHIYNLLLIDEHQRTKQSYVCIYGLPLEYNYHTSSSKNDRSSVMVSTVNNFPSLYTLSAFQICRQIRNEMSDALRRFYRSRTLIVTVISVDKQSACPSRGWPLDISYFPLIRFNIVMSDGTAEALSDCLYLVAALLKNRRDLSLHLIEIRLAYSYSYASDAVRNNGLALYIGENDIVQSMRQLVPLLQQHVNRTISVKDRRQSQVKVSWGVSKEQIESGEYDCLCSYLSGTCLEQMWQKACSGFYAEDVNLRILLTEEDCRQFGCHCHLTYQYY